MHPNLDFPIQNKLGQELVDEARGKAGATTKVGGTDNIEKSVQKGAEKGAEKALKRERLKALKKA